MPADPILVVYGRMVIILGLATVGLVILTAITWTTEDWQSVTAGLSLLPLAFAAVVLFVAWLALGCAWAIEHAGKRPNR